ncbi:hypothetical protein AX16_010355 [Volvariella volvacea WC 439]|nr:hypothetical protein AX16_010355 [Volvariella volvacea WC 439]
MPIVEKRQTLPEVHHSVLDTTFCGIVHPLSTPDAPIHQYLGIKYASVPARFRQSTLLTKYPPVTDASKHGPICPQIKNARAIEEVLFGVPEEEIPQQLLKHDEFECLNLNITCPGDLSPQSRTPVMVWIHGGGDRGSGSSWIYDGGAFVRKSITIGKPVILVTFNYRLGLFGFAASPSILEDNKLAGDQGVGNYGLRDQQTLFKWLRLHISDFGGDPHNLTVFGESTGAADILCHLLSSENEKSNLFQRAIIQSAVFDHNLPDVRTAGGMLSRIVPSPGGMFRPMTGPTIEQLRAIEAETMIPYGQSIRAIDDGYFFLPTWKDFLRIGEVQDPFEVASSVEQRRHHILPRSARSPSVARISTSRHRNSSQSVARSSSRLRAPSTKPSRSRSVARPGHATGARRHATLLPATIRQPLIIGDCACDSLLWSLPISLWTSQAVTRRINAVCQSLSKSNSILRAYDISAYTPDEEIFEHVLELVNDARVAWPTECVAHMAKKERGDKGVWRYVFDQEGPSRGVPHHAADLVYLFDNVPLPKSCLAAEEGDGTGIDENGMFVESFDDLSEEDEAMAQDSARKFGGGSGGSGSGGMMMSGMLTPPAGGRRGDSDIAIDLMDPAAHVTHLSSYLESLSSPSSSSTTSPPLNNDPFASAVSPEEDEDQWIVPIVDAWTYTRVRDTMQERWIAFAHNEVPWKEDKVFVFGPEGETGERSKGIFEGRRRRQLWKDVFEPVGMRLVQKLGVELSRGPGMGGMGPVGCVEYPRF